MSKETLTLLFGRVIIQYHTININNKAIYKKLTQIVKKMVIIVLSPVMPRAGNAIKNKLSVRTRTDTKLSRELKAPNSYICPSSVSEVGEYFWSCCPSGSPQWQLNLISRLITHYKKKILITSRK